MPEFQLDTSGKIECVTTLDFPTSGLDYEWEDLDAFTQGYTRAVFETFRKGDIGFWPDNLAAKKGFSSLAPETLAQIMEDCAADQRAGLKLNLAGNTEDRTSFKAGAEFWWERQSGNLFDARPLTPILCDDGKVRFQ